MLLCKLVCTHRLHKLYRKSFLILLPSSNSDNLSVKITCVFGNVFYVGRYSLHIICVSVFGRTLLFPKVNFVRWAIMNVTGLVSNSLTDAIFSTILRSWIVAVTFYGHDSTATRSTALRVAKGQIDTNLDIKRIICI